MPSHVSLFLFLFQETSVMLFFPSYSGKAEMKTFEANFALSLSSNLSLSILKEVMLL